MDNPTGGPTGYPAETGVPVAGVMSSEGLNEVTPNRTTPTGKLGDAPTGTRTEIRGNAEQKRAHQRENESANILSAAGYQVEQNPGVRPDNDKEPDYKLEGEYADCYAPSGNSIDKVRNKISSKVKDAQASRVIVNLSDTELTTSDIQEVLQRKPVAGLEEVISITRDNSIKHIFP